jgi:hypothetical protein
MSDTYQPVYDAVRSRLGNCDVSAAVSEALRVNLDLSSLHIQAQHALQSVQLEHTRPSVLFRPKIGIDGNKWSALYGEDLQNGVCGFGDSPEEAMRDFDRSWEAKLGVRP